VVVVALAIGTVGDAPLTRRWDATVATGRTLPPVARSNRGGIEDVDSSDRIMVNWS
jgi:hypothetical protein